MTEQEFEKLRVGDKVRIASKKEGTYWNPEGTMDVWLGKVMTIAEMYPYGTIAAFMEEDKAWWTWYPEMIAEKIDS